MNFDTVLDKNYGMKLLQLIADPVWVLPISQFPTNTTIRGYYSSTSKKSFPQEPVFCLETTTLSGWFSKSNNWKICFKPQKVDKRSYFLISDLAWSSPPLFSQKVVLKICSKFTGEHPCRTVIWIKLQSNTCKSAAYLEDTFSQ